MLGLAVVGTTVGYFVTDGALEGEKVGDLVGVEVGERVVGLDEGDMVGLVEGFRVVGK